MLQGTASSLAAAAVSAGAGDGVDADEAPEEAAARATAAASASLLVLWRQIRQRLLLLLRTAVRAYFGHLTPALYLLMTIPLLTTGYLLLTRCARTSVTSSLRPSKAAR